MSNIDSLIANVSNDLKKYDSFGVIDEDSLYRDIVLAIKEFGNDATLNYEDVILIENGIGKLPDNFYKLNDALLAEPIAFERENKKARLHTFMGSKYYNLIHELKTSWNECDDCCKEKGMRVFKKELIVEDCGKVTCNFNKTRRVILKKDSIKKYCSKSFNFNSDCDSEISIRRDQVVANFDKGYLYINYLGFALDDEGNFDFEETPNGNLESYLEYLLKTKVIERLILQKVQGLDGMLQYFDNKRMVHKKRAKTELKMNGLRPKQLTRRIALQNIKDYNKLSLQ